MLRGSDILLKTLPRKTFSKKCKNAILKGTAKGERFSYLVNILQMEMIRQGFMYKNTTQMSLKHHFFQN